MGLIFKLDIGHLQISPHTAYQRVAYYIVFLEYKIAIVPSEKQSFLLRYSTAILQ